MNGDLTLDELYASANEMCRRHWGVDYTGKIKLTKRKWRSLLGCFQYSPTDPTDCWIKMSTSRNAEYTKIEVLDTLLHELIHWRLYTQGKPYGDGDDMFISESLRVGASLSNSKSAQEAYKTYLAKLGYEQRTGNPYDEGVSLIGG